MDQMLSYIFGNKNPIYTNKVGMILICGRTDEKIDIGILAAGAVPFR